MARVWLLGALLCAMASIATTPLDTARSQTTLRLITQSYIADGSDTKFPHVDAASGQVAVAANSNKRDALAWLKQDSATSFPASTRMGAANGEPDDSPAAVELLADGSAYVAWIDQPSKQIFMRKRWASGGLDTTRLVNQGALFAKGVEIAVTSDGVIFVIWRNPVEANQLSYRRSTDDGASWSARRLIVDTAIYDGPISVAAGPSNQLAVAYTAGVSDKLQIFVALYSNGEFQSQRVSILGADYADPGLSYGPDGKLMVAWRGVSLAGSESSAGFWFAERPANGSFAAPVRLAGGKLLGTANIALDSGGNQHFSWIAEVATQPRAYYAYRPANGSFVGPIEAPVDGANLVNPRAAANLSSGGAYNHLISEAFTGGRLRIRYHLFAAPVALSATPTIEGGSGLVGNRSAVSVSFTVQGQPNQVRWRWGSPPVDTANDSSGWVAFTNPLTVSIPDRLRTTSSCEPVKLFTQVRNTSLGLAEALPNHDEIIIDSAVTLNLINVLNPFSAQAANDPPVALSVTAASDGDPQYTRIPSVNIEISGSADCAGLDTLALGKDASTLGPALQISNNAFDSTVSLPSVATVARGRNDFTLRVRDKLGNAQDFPSFIFYDDEAPVLNAANPGILTISVDPDATLIADLSFSAINLTDQVYPGRGFWGVWLANSRTPVADPLNDATLSWVALPAPGQSTSFSISSWSLATGIAPASRTPGSYYVYARFLDGAGNPTSSYLSATVNLATVTEPQLHLPLIVK